MAQDCTNISIKLDNTEFLKALNLMEISAENSLKAIQSVLLIVENSINGLSDSIYLLVDSIGIFESINKSINDVDQSFQNAQISLSTYKQETGVFSDTLNQVDTALSIVNSTIGILATGVEAASGGISLFNVILSSLGGTTGLVITAIGALLIGITAFCSSSDEEAEKMKVVTEHIREQTDAWNDLKNKQSEIILGNLAEIDHTKELSMELANLVDVNGLVKEGYADRVSFILQSLNNALGTEYELTNGVIKGYGELGKAIEDLIVKERAQIILEGEKEKFTEAIKEKTHALTELSALESEYTEAKAKNEAELIDLEIQKKEAENLNDQSEYSRITNKMLALTDETENKKKAYDEQLALVNRYNETINQYDADLVAVKTGNIDAMNAINERYANSYMENGELIKLELNQRVDNEFANLASLQQLREDAEKIKNESERKYKLESLDANIMASQARLDEMMMANGKELSEFDQFMGEKLSKASELQTGLENNDKNITKKQVEESQLQVVQGLEAYGKYVNQKVARAQELRNKLNNNDKSVTQEMVTAAESQAESALKGYKKVSSNVVEAMQSLPEDTRAIFGNMLKPMAEEMDKAKVNLWDSASNLAGGILNNLKKAFVINSPSRKTREIFKNVVLGAEEGFNDEKSNLLRETSNLSNDIIDSLSNPVSELKSKLGELNIRSLFDSIQNAVFSEQLRMSSVVQTQSKIEMLKMNILKAENQSIQGKLDAVIENHVDLDGRELAVALAPMISEELAFNWR